jgi:hypothetical protein
VEKPESGPEAVSHSLLAPNLKNGWLIPYLLFVNLEKKKEKKKKKEKLRSFGRGNLNLENSSIAWTCMQINRANCLD